MLFARPQACTHDTHSLLTLIIGWENGTDVSAGRKKSMKSTFGIVLDVHQATVVHHNFLPLFPCCCCCFPSSSSSPAFLPLAVAAPPRRTWLNAPCSDLDASSSRSTSIIVDAEVIAVRPRCIDVSISPSSAVIDVGACAGVAFAAGVSQGECVTVAALGPKTGISMFEFPNMLLSSLPGLLASSGLFCCCCICCCCGGC